MVESKEVALETIEWSGIDPRRNNNTLYNWKIEYRYPPGNDEDEVETPFWCLYLMNENGLYEIEYFGLNNEGDLVTFDNNSFRILTRIFRKYREGYIDYRIFMEKFVLKPDYEWNYFL